MTTMKMESSVPKEEITTSSQGVMNTKTLVVPTQVIVIISQTNTTMWCFSNSKEKEGIHILGQHDSNFQHFVGGAQLIGNELECLELFRFEKKKKQVVHQTHKKIKTTTDHIIIKTTKCMMLYITNMDHVAMYIIGVATSQAN
jgi:hypothetical protein